MKATPTVRVRLFERFRDRATAWDWGDGLYGILARLADRHALSDITWTIQAASEVASTAWRGNPPAERRFYKLWASCPRRGSMTLELWPAAQEYRFSSSNIQNGIPHGVAGGAK